jgi:hypothetical protein
MDGWIYSKMRAQLDDRTEETLSKQVDRLLEPYKDTSELNAVIATLISP